jgi:hypothetical protein
MKKIALIIGISLLLASCNMPRVAPDPDIAIATNVALVLTNAPTTTPLPNLNDGIVSTPTLAPIKTEELTATEVVPAEPVVQETAVPTVSPTEAPSATPTSAPTVAPSSDDPAVRLGEPTKRETFDRVTGVWTYENDWYNASVSGGQLHIYSKGTPYWNSWYTVQPALKNFYLEASLTMANCDGKDRVGLAFRLTDNEYYFVGLTCDGTIGMSRYTADNMVVSVLAYQTSDKLNPTSHLNRIGVMANGSEFQIYVNGNAIGQVKDEVLPNAGSYGFVSMSTGTTSMKTSVEELTYWVLP